MTPRETLRQLLTHRRAPHAAGAAVVLLAVGAVAFSRDEARPPSAEPVTAEPVATADTVAPDTTPQRVGRPAITIPDDSLFTFAPIADGVPRVAKPEVVKALYLNAWAAGSSRKLAKLIDIADRTEINAFVIDVKEGGEVSYKSQVPLARAIGADQEYIRNVRGMLQQLREHGIYPIARIVVFKDRMLAHARPDWAVRHTNGGDWVDADGYPWVDSFNKQVWDYNIAIAREALELGFSEVQWDYVRFPDVPQALMEVAAWPARNGRYKADAIREFLLYSRAQLAAYEVPVTADVFGLTVSVRTDMGIGQLWEKMVDATDVLLPMVYPSHFARGSYGIAQPNAAPRETILKAMQHAVRRTAGVPNAATIRPWLQDFTLGAPRYTATHVRAQIDAVYEAGLQEWVLWNPGSNYTVDALCVVAETDCAVRVMPVDSAGVVVDTTAIRR